MLTTKEAAEMLQISENSIRVWLNNEAIRQKKFPNASKFGPVWQIPEYDIKKHPVGRKPGRPAKKRAG